MCAKAHTNETRPPIARRRLALFIARPAPRVAAARARLRSVRPAGYRARSAAGVTWTCRTAKAEWAGRSDHTSVVDAAGAIYVIGGAGGHDNSLEDVWASTDGGARAGLGQRGVVGGSTGWGTRGVPHGTKGY